MFQLESSLEGMNIVTVLLRRGNAQSCNRATPALVLDRCGVVVPSSLSSAGGSTTDNPPRASRRSSSSRASYSRKAAVRIANSSPLCAPAGPHTPPCTGPPRNAQTLPSIPARLASVVQSSRFRESGHPV
jgi:hypothetical protein